MKESRPLITRKHPDYLQRARWHDYKSRCIYLITLMKSPAIPPLSEIHRHPGPGKLQAYCQNTSAGELIDHCLRQWLSENPAIRPLGQVIMPDHIHLVLFVTAPLTQALGRYIRDLKSLCTSEYRVRFNLPSDSDQSFFTPGFNDKIVFRRGQKQNFINYVNDNPRRYLARRLYPEYFRRAVRISINGTTYSAYGNLFLLEKPLKSAVRISRSYTPAELTRKHKEWEEAIRAGGVLVSPFISPAEKAVRDQAIAGGASLIIIVDNGFPERYKPPQSQFQLCLEGRLLLIGPADHTTRLPILSREKALQANALAATIALLPTK